MIMLCQLVFDPIDEQTHINLYWIHNKLI